MSVIDTALSALGQEQIQQLSRNVGAEPIQVQNAVQVALPLLLAAFARRAAQQGGADELMSATLRHGAGALQEAKDHGPIDVQEGQQILEQVFGARTQEAENAVARAAGTSPQAAHALLITLAPILLGALGRERSQQNFDANNLASLLQRELASVPQKLPFAAGLLGNLPGAGGNPLDDLNKLLG